MVSLCNIINVCYSIQGNLCYAMVVACLSMQNKGALCTTKGLLEQTADFSE